MTYKIIFTGPVGAGKTTAIGVLSDTPTISTNEMASDETRLRKLHTTVALDFGTVDLASGVAIHLYGTPGQERFSFMWEILIEGGIGLVLLIDNSSTHPFADLRQFVSAFRQFIDQTALAVGITCMDIRAEPTIEDYQRELCELGLSTTPVFTVDARQRRDVSLLVEALLCSLDLWSAD